MSEIKQEIRDLAGEIKNDIKLDTQTGVATVSSNELYKKHLPDGVTIELIEKIQEHNTTFAAASGLAFGELSTEAMVENKSLPETSLEIPTVGKDYFSLSFKRDQKVPSTEGGTKLTHGTLTVSLEFYGTKNRGELTKVKQELTERAKRLLSD